MKEKNLQRSHVSHTEKGRENATSLKKKDAHLYNALWDSSHDGMPTSNLHWCFAFDLSVIATFS